MQEIMDSLTEFLKYHGVTLSADPDPAKSKIVFMSSSRKPLILSCFNRQSRPGSINPFTQIVLTPRNKSHVFVYLGGRLSLDLNWPAICKASKVGVDRELSKNPSKEIQPRRMLSLCRFHYQRESGLPPAGVPLSRLHASAVGLVPRHLAQNEGGCPFLFLCAYDARSEV